MSFSPRFVPARLVPAGQPAFAWSDLVKNLRSGAGQGKREYAAPSGFAGGGKVAVVIHDYTAGDGQAESASIGVGGVP